MLVSARNNSQVQPGDRSGEEKLKSDLQERQELFSTSDDPDNLRQSRVKDQHAQDVTTSLLALRGMLHTQVESNKETLQSLFSSSHTVTATKNEMEGIGADMKRADGLISKYERRELTDKVLIGAGLCLFFGVVLYILQKRLLGWIW